MKSDLVSVVIPVFNSSSYLRRCLDSVLGQTYDSIEVICINDCSTDDSLIILKEYEAKDPRIRILNNPQNMGVSYSRNEGIKCATGEWIAFVDSDDWIERDMYEKMLSHVRIYHSQIVMSDLLVNENDSIKDYSLKALKQEVYHKGDINKELLPRFSWPGQENLGLFSFTTKIFRSSLIKDNDIYFETQTSYEEDKLFVINALANCNCVSYINQNFYKYEVHIAGLYSSFNKDAWKWYIFNYDEKQRLIKEYGIANINLSSLKEEFIYNISWYIKRCSRQSDCNSKDLQLLVLTNSDVIRICNECIPHLTSIDRRIALAIKDNRSFLALLLIGLNFSPYKKKILSVLNKFKRK